ncbi:MAG: phage integrase SAM-like domain-containing protein [Paracoccaceae bacterium]|nr:phage integrase SAM-like domain-containing protein [Paracoccaceae bacterium]
MSIIDRNGTFHLVKRVPVRFRSVEPRRQIWLTLNTDSLRGAEKKAPAVWETQVTAWEAMLDGNTDVAEERYEAAKRLAKARGYRFLGVEQVARLPLPEVLSRIDATFEQGKADRLTAEALLGGAAKPEITMSRALELFWTVAADQTRGKSPDQLRRWRNPRMKAFRNFIDVVGDLPVGQVTGDNMLDFRDWWWERIQNEGLTPNSANKDFTHIASVLRLLNKRKRWGLALPLEGLAFSEDKARIRPPLPADWIREHMLAPGALDGLNTEARCIFLGMVNTGYRPSEGAALPPEAIRLDTGIPHIEITAANRSLKTSASRRVIPLAGVSLEAFRQCPGGFPRYMDNPGLSSTINKFMRANRLYPDPIIIDGEPVEHTMYSLRHAFEDRLLDHDVDERIRRDLMGHTLNRERYGKGASLEKLHEIVTRIAL